MQQIEEKYHGKRCGVYTEDFVEPFVGVVTISQPSVTMIILTDEEGKQRPISRASIRRIELDEPGRRVIKRTDTKQNDHRDVIRGHFTVA